MKRGAWDKPFRCDEQKMVILGATSNVSVEVMPIGW